MIPARCLMVFLVCLALPGCYLKTYGYQSADGATTTSSQFVAAGKFSNGAASFTSGQPVSPAAPGGQVAFGRGAAIVAVGLVFAEAVHYLGALFGPGPQAAPTGSIAETCSCYQKPVTREE